MKDSILTWRRIKAGHYASHVGDFEVKGQGTSWSLFQEGKELGAGFSAKGEAQALAETYVTPANTALPKAVPPPPSDMPPAPAAAPPAKAQPPAVVPEPVPETTSVDVRIRYELASLNMAIAELNSRMTTLADTMGRLAGAVQALTGTLESDIHKD